MPLRGRPNIPPRQRTKLPEEEEDVGGYCFQYDPDHTDPQKRTTSVQADKRPVASSQREPTPVGQTTGATQMKETSSKKKPKRKGKGKKRATTSDDESDYNNDGDDWWPDESQDITKGAVDDYGVPIDNDQLIAQLIAAATIESDAAEATPGTTASEAIPPPAPATSSLRPPARDDTSSSASSRGSKRPRDTSPDHRRKAPRESRRGGRNIIPGVARPHSPARQYRPPPPRPPSPPHERIRQLERQLQQAQERLADEYRAGLQEGRTRGFEDAMRAAGIAPRPAPPPSIREPPRGRSPPRRSHADHWSPRRPYADHRHNHVGPLCRCVTTPRAHHGHNTALGTPRPQTIPPPNQRNHAASNSLFERRA